MEIVKTSIVFLNSVAARRDSILSCFDNRWRLQCNLDVTEVPHPEIPAIWWATHLAFSEDMGGKKLSRFKSDAKLFKWRPLLHKVCSRRNMI